MPFSDGEQAFSTARNSDLRVRQSRERSRFALSRAGDACPARPSGSGGRHPHPQSPRAAADPPAATGPLILETGLLGPLTVPDGAASAAELEELSRRAAVYATRGDGTRRAYRSAWRHYAAWCAGLGREPLAADPDTTAMYVVRLADTGRKGASGQAGTEPGHAARGGAASREWLVTFRNQVLPIFRWQTERSCCLLDCRSAERSSWRILQSGASLCVLR